jgi:hypothetical protein
MNLSAVFPTISEPSASLFERINLKKFAKASTAEGHKDGGLDVRIPKLAARIHCQDE